MMFSKLPAKLPDLASLQKKAFRWIDENLDKTLSLYPPYLGAGVKVREISDDYRYIRVEMPLRPYNRNYVGTHFGGSLYSMCDPFYMLMLMKNLGPDYIVWDRAAYVEFKKPGRGLVVAEFHLSQERIDEIRKAAEGGRKVEPVFMVDVKDRHGEVVASIEKVLYVREKRR